MKAEKYLEAIREAGSSPPTTPPCCVTLCADPQFLAFIAYGVMLSIIRGPDAACAGMFLTGIDAGYQQALRDVAKQQDVAELERLAKLEGE